MISVRKQKNCPDPDPLNRVTIKIVAETDEEKQALIGFKRAFEKRMPGAVEFISSGGESGTLYLYAKFAQE